MKNFSNTNRLRNNKIPQNQSIQNLAENHVESLKSLVNLVMQELASLQKLSSKKNEIAKNEKFSLPDEVEEYEIELIRTALIQTGGHQRNAADMLGIKTTTLNAKMKRYGIEPRIFLV